MQMSSRDRPLILQHPDVFFSSLSFGVNVNRLVKASNLWFFFFYWVNKLRTAISMKLHVEQMNI